jgi:hypothetical protein
MTLLHLFTIHSIIALANGLVFLVVPVEYLSIFGIPISGSGTIFICRLFAAALLTYGLVAWFARRAGPSEARRAILLGYCIPIAIGFVLTLVAQLTGVMNAFGWALVVLYLTMASGYGYFALREPGNP